MGHERHSARSYAYVLLVATIAVAPLAIGPGTAAANHDGGTGPTFAVGQDGRCVAEIHPLGNGTQTGPAYYDYRDFGSFGTIPLQRTYVSQLYVYDGSDGTSLVVLHDRVGDGDGGGAVTFNVTGLPADGAWSVLDDDYEELGFDPDNQNDTFDTDGSAHQLNWMYGNNKTDGGVFLGLGSDGWAEITIDPAFGEDSYGGRNGWEQAAEGPNDWQVRTADGNTETVNMNQPVSIRAGACDAVSPSVTLSTSEHTSTEVPVTLNASTPDGSTAPIEYHWDFDSDGVVDDTTESATVDRSYDEPGEVTIGVTATDRFGNNDTATTTFTVENGTPPFADGDVPATAGTGEPVTVDASNSSDESGIASYEWDFGDDGGTATGVNATYAYETAGNYTVSLTVTDAVGKTDTDTATVSVTDATPPDAVLSVPETAEKNETITFDATGSTDNGEIAEYRWRIDGEALNATPEGAIQHNFSDAGDHVVVVTVVDDEGNQDSANGTVHVIDETPPNASLAAPANATVGVEVTMDASGSTDNVGIESYEWAFGDGDSTSTTHPDETVTHVYGSPGTYTPTVRVVDDDGNADTADAAITVSTDPSPTAVVSANRTEAAVGDAIRFDGNASTDDEGIERYEWDFGDGDGDTTPGVSVTHAYRTAGTYNVTLTVIDTDGHADSATETVRVIDVVPPNATFTVSDDSPTTGQSITFDASDSTDDSGIDSYTWDFGDGDNATGEVTQHTYTAAGNYTVELAVTDDGDNEDAATRRIAVANATAGGDGGSGDDGDGGGGSGGGSPGGGAQPRGGGSAGGGSVGSGSPGGGGVPAEDHDDDSGTEDGNQSTVPAADDASASIAVAGVAVDPSEVLAGENVSIVATVENDGTASGAEAIDLRVDDRVVATRTVTLATNETGRVNFTARLEVAGERILGVGDRSAAVTVLPREPDVSVVDLVVEEEGVTAGETTTVVATVTNGGEGAGQATIALRVFGEVVDRRVVSLAPGETRAVRFTQRFDSPGNYTVGVGPRRAAVTVTGESAGASLTLDVPNGTDRTTGLGFVAAGGLALAVVALLMRGRL